MTPEESAQAFIHALYYDTIGKDINASPYSPLKGNDIERTALLSVLCFLSDSVTRHVLLEGHNGTGKTELAKRLNWAVLGSPLRDLLWSMPEQRDILIRVDGNSDLTPLDLKGSDTLSNSFGSNGMASQRLSFRDGPLLNPGMVFYNDELNRSPPTTQGALLAAMGEGQVTFVSVDEAKKTKIKYLRDFFMVASQNFGTHEGTYPLPAANLDRFMIKRVMMYTEHLDEILKNPTSTYNSWVPTRADDFVVQTAINCIKGLSENARFAWEWFRMHREHVDAASLMPVVGKLESDRRTLLSRYREVVGQVPVSPEANDTILRLVYSLQPEKEYLELKKKRPELVLHKCEADSKKIRAGPSPRGAKALRDLAKPLALATWNGKGNLEVSREHVRCLAIDVLRHRVLLEARYVTLDNDFDFATGHDDGSKLVQRALDVEAWS
jgi:MoxR-like ATPase